MLRRIGRGLQLLGMTLLPLAMVLELSQFLGREFGLSQMLIMLVAGMAAFLLGRIVEGYAGG